MPSQFVVFVYPASTDVYERIDHGHGRIEYRPVAAQVVRQEPPAGGLLRDLGSLLVSVLMAVVSG